MSENSNYLDFILPTKVKFGVGMRQEIVAEIPDKNPTRIGMVTSKEILQLNLHQDITSELEKRNCTIEVFPDVESNPHLSTIVSGYRFFADFNPDFLIGLGGGSVIDSAKAIALGLANGEPDITTLDATKRKIHDAVPFFAVPTTSGTGSEVDYWAVMSDPETHEKMSVGYPEMSPLTAIVDPELTLTLPPELTLFTGIDALSHAVEAFFSSSSNKVSDMLSLAATDLVFSSLSPAVENGNNLQARTDMSLASTMAGAAMQHVGLGLVHALSHQVSGFYDTNHGLANALLMPSVLQFNIQASQEKYTRLSGYLDEDFLTKLNSLYSNHSIEEKEVTVYKQDLDELARRAVDNVNAETNPRKATLEDAKKIYKQAFKVS